VLELWTIHISLHLPVQRWYLPFFVVENLGNDGFMLGARVVIPGGYGVARPMTFIDGDQVVPLCGRLIHQLFDI
jgi:hypothetical protein